jgi:hypothetical protein
VSGNAVPRALLCSHADGLNRRQSGEIEFRLLDEQDAATFLR